jgi:hypothetical protein
MSSNMAYPSGTFQIGHQLLVKEKLTDAYRHFVVQNYLAMSDSSHIRVHTKKKISISNYG